MSINECTQQDAESERESLNRVGDDLSEKLNRDAEKHGHSSL
jgi:hypothetical protein